MLGLSGGSQCGAPDAQLSEPSLAPWRPGLWCLVPLGCGGAGQPTGPSPPGAGDPHETDWPFCWML